MNRLHETATSLSVVEGTAALGALLNDSGATVGNVVLFPDADDATNRGIADHQDALTDWTYGPVDLAEEVRKIRSWSRDLVDRFFPSRCAPAFLFRFEREGPRGSELLVRCERCRDLFKRKEVS